MGTYLNPGNAGFVEMLQSDYVDKTGMISLINSTIGTKQKLTCISRPRRFGKSYAAQMLCAYYDKTCIIFNGKSFLRETGMRMWCIFQSMIRIGPALVVELKWDKSAEGAIEQILAKHYPYVLKDYGSEILLVGINYDKDALAGERKHECKIVKCQMT